MTTYGIRRWNDDSYPEERYLANALEELKAHLHGEFRPEEGDRFEEFHYADAVPGAKRLWCIRKSGNIGVWWVVEY